MLIVLAFKLWGALGPKYCGKYLKRSVVYKTLRYVVYTRSSADADNALDANEAVPNKWRADGTHNTYQSY